MLSREALNVMARNYSAGNLEIAVAMADDIHNHRVKAESSLIRLAEALLILEQRTFERDKLLKSIERQSQLNAHNTSLHIPKDKQVEMWERLGFEIRDTLTFNGSERILEDVAKNES